MQHRALASLMDFLRREMPPPGSDLISDGDLLGRFVATRDEPAFELLVRRHGPLVWGIARRMLRDEHAAEDVLQATFLALARQAKSLRKQPAVAAWLARVAGRIAIKARAKVAIIPNERIGEEDPAIAAERAELRATLDEAIDRLPEKLRRTVVLCYLSGHTTEHAARLLNCPKGTILSRLSAAREKLRGDLTRQGVTVTTAALTATLTAESAPAVLPAALIALAVKAAGPSAALTPIVITLAQGAVAMSWSKLAIAAVGAMSVGVIGFGLAGPGNGPQAETQTQSGVIALSAAGDTPKIQKPDASPAAAEAARQRQMEIDKMRQKIDAEIADVMTETSHRRIDLKMQVFELEMRAKLIQEGIQEFSGKTQGAMGYAFMKEFAPEIAKTYFKETDELKTMADLMARARAALAKNQRDIFKTQEELRLMDELSSMRIDALKRRYAAVTDL